MWDQLGVALGIGGGQARLAGTTWAWHLEDMLVKQVGIGRDQEQGFWCIVGMIPGTKELQGI